MKRTARKLERKWKISKSKEDHEAMKKHYNNMYGQIRRDRINYNKTKIAECKREQKRCTQS